MHGGQFVSRAKDVGGREGVVRSEGWHWGEVKYVGLYGVRKASRGYRDLVRGGVLRFMPGLRAVGDGWEARAEGA